MKFAEYHNLTPLTLINATKLVEAQHLAKTEMTMKASQQLEFVRLQIKRRIEKLAEQYVEHFKMKNGVYTEGVNLVVKKALPKAGRKGKETGDNTDQAHIQRISANIKRLSVYHQSALKRY